MRTASLASNNESCEQERICRAVVSGGIVVALLLAVFLLRFYSLGDMPPGIQNDEGPDGVEALRVLQGEHAFFFPERGAGREAVGVYSIALTTSILGRSLLAFRLPSALASAGTVVVVFWLGQLLFGRDEESGQATPWRGLLVGGVGAGLMAVSISQTFLARAGLRANFLPFFLSLSFALLWWAWQQRDRLGGPWWKVALAGACAGLLLHTYLAARFSPFLFLLFGLSFLLPLRATSRAMERTVPVKQYLPWVGLFVGVAGLVAAPLLIHFALHPEDFFIRSRQLWLFNEGQGNALRAFLNNAWEHLLVLGFHGDRVQRYNFAGQPMLNPWQAIFLGLGVGMAVYRWQRSPAYRLLSLWLGVLILPAMLADSGSWGPNTLRMIGAAPAIYLLIGCGMWETYRFLRARSFAFAWRQRPILFENETKVAIAAAAIVVGLILVQGVVTYRSFFVQWAGTPAYYRAYQAEWADAARVLNAQQTDEDVVYILPYPWQNEHSSDVHYGFEYLYQGAAPAHILSTITPHNLAQKVETALSAEESFTTVSFVDWNNELFGGDARSEEHTITLLGKYGRYLRSDEYGSFQIHTFRDVSLDRPWTLYDRLQPLTIHYDKGISLQGLALGQAEGQLSSNGKFLVEDARSLWVALKWQTAPGLEIDFAISMRLHNVEGGSVYQKDFVLSNSEPASTSHWLADELVDTLFYLDLPADLRPGEYELRLVVYDFETLEPTVELDVWKPELVLAHLSLAAIH